MPIFLNRAIMDRSMPIMAWLIVDFSLVLLLSFYIRWIISTQKQKLEYLIRSRKAVKYSALITKK